MVRGLALHASGLLKQHPASSSPPPFSLLYPQQQTGGLRNSLLVVNLSDLRRGLQKTCLWSVCISGPYWK